MVGWQSAVLTSGAANSVKPYAWAQAYGFDEGKGKGQTGAVAHIVSQFSRTPPRPLFTRPGRSYIIVVVLD